MVSDEDFQTAEASAGLMESHVPRALSARYDRSNGRIVIELRSGLGIFFSPQDREGLESATPGHLCEIEISPSGYGIHFPKLDADLYLPALFEGIFGSERWMAGREQAADAGTGTGANTHHEPSAAKRSEGS